MALDLVQGSEIINICNKKEKKEIKMGLKDIHRANNLYTMNMRIRLVMSR